MTRDALVKRLRALPVEMAEIEKTLLDVATHALVAKRALELVEAELIVEGKAEGKNAEIRAAQLHLQTEPERQTLSRLENTEARFKMQLRNLDREFTALRAIARLLNSGDE